MERKTTRAGQMTTRLAQTKQKTTSTGQKKISLEQMKQKTTTEEQKTTRFSPADEAGDHYKRPGESGNPSRNQDLGKTETQEKGRVFTASTIEAGNTKSSSICSLDRQTVHHK